MDCILECEDWRTDNWSGDQQDCIWHDAEGSVHGRAYFKICCRHQCEGNSLTYADVPETVFLS